MLIRIYVQRTATQLFEGSVNTSASSLMRGFDSSQEGRGQQHGMPSLVEALSMTQANNTDHLKAQLGQVEAKLRAVAQMQIDPNFSQPQSTIGMPGAIAQPEGQVRQNLVNLNELQGFFDILAGVKQQPELAPNSIQNVQQRPPEQHYSTPNEPQANPNLAQPVQQYFQGSQVPQIARAEQQQSMHPQLNQQFQTAHLQQHPSQPAQSSHMKLQSTGYPTSSIANLPNQTTMTHQSQQAKPQLVEHTNHARQGELQSMAAVQGLQPMVNLARLPPKQIQMNHPNFQRSVEPNRVTTEVGMAAKNHNHIHRQNFQSRNALKDVQLLQSSSEMYPEQSECSDLPKKIRRRRLNSEQALVLEQEYLRNPQWSTARITSLAKRLRLGRTKVYKWSWDRKKQDRAEAEQQGATQGMPNPGQNGMGQFTSNPHGA